ncbi:MAG TPA: ATP-binding protein [Terriglobales bacterium]|nr:ATP-binding protein [Terriglobales bacterium]
MSRSNGIKYVHGRRRYHKALRVVRTLRRAVQNCQELVFVTDAKGVIQYANRACEILTGYEVPEIVDRRFGEITAELPNSPDWEFMRKRALELGVFRGVTGLRCQNGNTTPVDLAITAVRDPHTGVFSLALTGHPLTVDRELARERSRARKMDAIGALASGVAHDFNNLLMVIGAHAEMGLANAKDEEALRRNLQGIVASVRRASELTRRLLNFGKQQEKGRQLIAINWVVQDTAAMLSRILEEDIEVEVVLSKNVGMVRADPGQIEELLLNLAVNARDAMPNGGHLVIETQMIRLGDDFAARHRHVTPGEHVLLTVSDSGHGISEEHMARIFEPYFTTKSAGKGTGLGLTMVKSIVEQNAGAISAESTPSHGTSFRIYFPAVTTATKKPSASWRDQSPTPRGQESVLVVEDSEPLRNLVVQFLSSLGYQAYAAADGEEALAILEKNKGIALMVIDHVLPRMNGADLAHALSSRSPRMLFMSGHAESVLQRRGINRNGTNFIEKPFSLKTLGLKIRQVLDEPVPARAAAARAGV